MSDLHKALSTLYDRFSMSHLCTEDVTRDGESQPCDKPAVAVRIDPTEGSPYPVCAHHARAQMVPLRDLLSGGIYD